MTYEEAVREVFYWQYENRRSFYILILTCFQKADHSNRLKLGAAFPSLFAAYMDWCSAAECGNALFKEHGLLKEPINDYD